MAVVRNAAMLFRITIRRIALDVEGILVRNGKVGNI